jgi:hypothetical protein
MRREMEKKRKEKKRKEKKEQKKKKRKGTTADGVDEKITIVPGRNNTYPWYKYSHLYRVGYPIQIGVTTRYKCMFSQ